MSDRTVYSLLEEAASARGDAPALYEPIHDGKSRSYLAHSWRKYKAEVEEAAAGLRCLGLQPGDIVALHADTSRRFYIADLGIMAGGGISAALYTSYPAAELVKTIRACDARMVFVQKPEMLRALFSAADPPLEVRWILLEGEYEDCLTLEALQVLGRTALAGRPALLEEVKYGVKPDDYAILYLTSGATGEPKMALVKHSALVANVDMGPQVVPLGPQDRSIAFLPSAHITQRVVMELMPIRLGMPVWFSEGLSRLPHELKAVQPTFLIAPPRVWERMYASICTEIRRRNPLTQRVFYGALGIGAEVARRKLQGEPIPAWMERARALAERLIFRKIRERLGGELRIAISGAAPLGKDLADFFAAIGLTIYEGYGLTEGGVLALNPVDRCKSGSIGKALPGVEYRIMDDGELVFRGPTLFSGYYKDPAATSTVLRDGWLHTGDVGEADNEGYLYITGRKKEVLVASNGKKIYPSMIESLYKMEPLINQVLLIGDRQPYVTAIFSLNWSMAETVRGMEPYKGKAPAELLKAAPLQQEVKRLVARVNKQLAPFEQIRKYHVLDREFSIENGELTPTMKIRRSRVLENYRKVVSDLYMGRIEEA